MGFEGKFNGSRNTSPSELVPEIASTLKGLEAKKSLIEAAPVETFQEESVSGNLTPKQEEELGETVRSVLENR